MPRAVDYITDTYKKPPKERKKELSEYEETIASFVAMDLPSEIMRINRDDEIDAWMEKVLLKF
jgi:thiamine biosynthesis lipoprotein ApbE